MRLGPVFDRGRGSSKWSGPGPGFLYYSSKAGTIEAQKRNTGRRGSSYTLNESSCRVEYESTTFFEVNTHYKYFSVDKPLCNFLFPLFEVFEIYFENPKSEKRSLGNDVENTCAKFHRNRSIMGKVFNVGGTI